MTAPDKATPAPRAVPEANAISGTDLTDEQLRRLVMLLGLGRIPRVETGVAA